MGIYSHVNKKMGQEYTFYDKVQKLAKNAGVSVAQVERDLGIEQQAKKWRKFTPNASTLCKLADYFSVSVDFLLDREDSLSDDENALIGIFRRLSAFQAVHVKLLSNPKNKKTSPKGDLC